MDQPGIEVRPLRQMTGHTNFNEVFLEDAIVHEADAVGGFGNGWTVTLTTLAHERANLSARSVAVGAAGHKAGFLDRRAGDFAPNARRAAPAGEIAPVPAARLASRLMALARERGRAEDPVLRQDLARLITLNEISRFTSLRMKAARAHGRDTGPTASTMKLAMSHTTRLTADLGLRVLGPHGMLHGVDAPSRGSLQDLALGAPAASIAGGTDEIQRNIIGERVLGLPREPSVE
jgi:alkylation response protein AidB-like acyl-CoA dehydrogenase